MKFDCLEAEVERATGETVKPSLKRIEIRDICHNKPKSFCEGNGRPDKGERHVPLLKKRKGHPFS